MSSIQVFLYAITVVVVMSSTPHPMLTFSWVVSGFPLFINCFEGGIHTCTDEEDEEEDVEEEEEEEQEVITVVYFWQGRDASEMGWLHFTHG